MTAAFEVFVHDDRYSVPTLHLITADDDFDARQAASALLSASPHHLGVELWRDGDQIAALGACSDCGGGVDGGHLRVVK